MYTLGIDIGSTTSKCVVLKDGQDIVGTSLIVAGIGTDGPAQALSAVLADAGLTEEQISYITVTGYGRSRYDGKSDAQVSELSCHALGGRFIFPTLRTIIDIGGQDAKAIALGPNGRMSNFIMNDKCAAGTGRFLDVMAGILQLQIGDLEKEAALSMRPAQISNTCTVFAESEVISQLANKVPRQDVVAGICTSVASRVASLAKRVGVVEDVCMSGGVARNGGVRKAMEQALGVPVLYDPRAQLFGAIGAALYGYQKLGNK